MSSTKIRIDEIKEVFQWSKEEQIIDIFDDSVLYFSLDHIRENILQIIAHN